MRDGDSWKLTDRHPRHGTATFTYEVTRVESDGGFDLREQNDKDLRVKHHHFDPSSEGAHMIGESHFDPMALQFPLFIGKTWHTEATVQTLAGRENSYKSYYVAEEYIQIDTDVGTYMAFRSRQEVRRSSSTNNWRGYFDHWYVPKAKVVIRSKPSHIRGAEIVEVNLVP